MGPLTWGFFSTVNTTVLHDPGLVESCRCGITDTGEPLTWWAGC